MDKFLTLFAAQVVFWVALGTLVHALVRLCLRV